MIKPLENYLKKRNENREKSRAISRTYSESLYFFVALRNSLNTSQMQFRFLIKKSCLFSYEKEML